MKPFTTKQRLVVLLIKLIEAVVNCRALIPVLSFLSNRFQRSLLRGCSSKRISIFQNLSVAFIADGNRRWHRMRSKSTGGAVSSSSLPVKNDKIDSGFRKIEEIIKFAYFNSLKEVSFFCFAVKNFKRPANEVNEIMDYIRDSRPLEHSLPIKLQIYGDMSLLRPDVQDSLKLFEERTKSNTGMTVNLFISYNSSNDEHSPNRFNKRVDILIRTSGEKRISDFMVRQVASGTAVDFVAPYWPELSLLHLNLILCKYLLEEKYLKD